MPKGKKHTPEQVVAILRRVDQGETAAAVYRNVNISETTLYRRKQQYGAMGPDEVKELKALRDENARLKRLVADQALNIQVLKEVNAKTVSPSPRRHAPANNAPIFGSQPLARPSDDDRVPPFRFRRVRPLSDATRCVGFIRSTRDGDPSGV